MIGERVTDMETIVDAEDIIDHGPDLLATENLGEMAGMTAEITAGRGQGMIIEMLRSQIARETIVNTQVTEGALDHRSGEGDKHPVQSYCMNDTFLM